MSAQLRDLIRQVRQCKSAAEERKVITTELANIRTAFKDKDKLEFRHRNVAKLMYVDMLGYATHFGQMEVLKLLSSKMFPEKRLGYLALMQLLDENTEILMLVTQSLKKDMAMENPFIVGLALCALGNIASADMARDLGGELEKLLKHSNPYIRKKALCTATRLIIRLPDMRDEYFKLAVATLEDTSQGHGPLVAAVQLLITICENEKKFSKKLRKSAQHIITRLNGLLRSNYDPDHDVGGVTDPFLQVYLLQLLRIVSVGDKKISDEVDSILAQIATNTESSKNPGNCVLYECVRTIMSIEAQSSLHVLAINILGRFLVNRDNNIRYVALNALCNVVQTNAQAVQRHRNTIIECLTDIDITIRRRALELIYTLTNKKNIKQLVNELLGFLSMSNNEPEFQHELASKICMVVERYSPSRRWHIDTVLQVLSTVPQFSRDNSISSLFILISNSPKLQPYATFKLFELSSKPEMTSDYIHRICSWCIGEYGSHLLSSNSAQVANIDDTLHYTAKTEDDIINLLSKIIHHDKTHMITKAFVLTAFLKLLTHFNSEKQEKMLAIINEYNDNIKLELQQRAVEYLNVIKQTQANVRSEILKPMPVPDIIKLIPKDEINGSGNGADANNYRDLLNELKDDDSGEEDNNENEKNEINFDDNIGNNDNADNFFSGLTPTNQSKQNKPKEDNKKKDKKNNEDEDEDEDANEEESNESESEEESDSEKKNSKRKNKSKSKKKPKKKNINHDIDDNNNNIVTIEKPPNGNLFPSNNTKTIEEDILKFGDLMNVGNGGTPNQTSNNTTNPNDFLSELLGTTSSPQSQPQSQSHSQSPKQQLVQPQGSSSSPSITVFQKDGITISFTFVKSDSPGTYRILATFTNSDSVVMNNFSFMVAVPKYVTLQIKPASGTQLLPFSQNNITQKIQLINTLHNQKPMMIRIQLSYDKNGQNIIERSQFSDFPN